MNNYSWPCPSCLKLDNGIMDAESFIVICGCGCQYDGLLNAAQWKGWYEEVKSLETTGNTCGRKEVEMTREEHLEWCKQRALDYVDMGDVNQAFASMASDLRKHPETENHSAIELGVAMIFGGHLSSECEMRKFIIGFN